MTDDEAGTIYLVLSILLLVVAEALPLRPPLVWVRLAVDAVALVCLLTALLLVFRGARF